MFSMEEFVSLHSSILSALICYYFDENTLKFMVKRLGLLRALTYQLQELLRRPQSQQQLKDVEIKEELPTDSSSSKPSSAVEYRSTSVEGSDNTEAIQNSEVSSPSGASYCQSLTDLDYSVKSSSRGASPEHPTDMANDATADARDIENTPEHSAPLLEAALPEPSSPLTSPLPSARGCS